MIQILTFTTDWVTILGVVLGVIFPIIVNIVTTLKTKPAIRATLLAVLSLATSTLTQLQHALVVHQEFNALNALLLGLGTFLVAVASAWGLWGPTNVSSYLRAKVGRTKNEGDADS